MNPGAILLSIWSGLNLVLALGILGSMVILGHHPPSLPMALGPSQIAALDPAALGLIHALALLANACIAGLCLLTLFVVWRVRTREARLALAASLVLVQIFGFFSDARLGNHNLAANLISTGILLAGLATCSWRDSLR